eukprot:CAMPEP_0183362044 /NCGR_PEP_ID=MMETSP0164_2-20130417/66139_1 /TAXON_ID=221442 /ORGANISM="Coccolithus pelagicus ssp braarudi, Strain PLY182g" /LENGTH=73 /DNA_ID=CAMNT_0025536805 /DNA_START=104 /DNA_END=321 /DNA_ORIENTATION=-
MAAPLRVRLFVDSCGHAEEQVRDDIRAQLTILLLKSDVAHAPIVSHNGAGTPDTASAKAHGALIVTGLDLHLG